MNWRRPRCCELGWTSEWTLRGLLRPNSSCTGAIIQIHMNNFHSDQPAAGSSSFRQYYWPKSWCLPVNKDMSQNIQWNKDRLRHIQKILCLKQIRPWKETQLLRKLKQLTKAEYQDSFMLVLASFGRGPKTRRMFSSETTWKLDNKERIQPNIKNRNRYSQPTPWERTIMMAYQVSI